MQSLTKRLESMCREAGAVAFGVVSVKDADRLPAIKIGSTVNKRSIKVKGAMPCAESIVMFGVESLDDADELSVRRRPGWFEYPGYDRLSEIRHIVIDLLRSEGFRAETLPELVPHKRLAVLAGFGTYGKNSMIISREHGLWLRFYGVVTDARLPKSRKSSKDLCGGCEKCVRACPVGAIAKPYVLDSCSCLNHVIELDEIPAKFAKAASVHSPNITANAFKMCTVCEMVCPHTKPERRRGALRCRRIGN